MSFAVRIAYMMKGPVETIESSDYVITPNSGGGGDGGTRRNVDFSEFMWMADEELEDFDRRVSNHVKILYNLWSGVS